MHVRIDDMQQNLENYINNEGTIIAPCCKHYIQIIQYFKTNKFTYVSF